MLLESYCGYNDDRKVKQPSCIVHTDGKEHLHTECRACRYNPFDFYTTLKIIRMKTSDIDPVWDGVYPKFDEIIFKYRSLEI